MSLALVKRVRAKLYPDLAGPPEKPLAPHGSDARLDDAFLITAHVAFQLRKTTGKPFGVAFAKPGSTNKALYAGKFYTCDVVALEETGEHWDSLGDGGGDSFSNWGAQKPENWPPIAARWAPTPITTDLFAGTEPPGDDPGEPPGDEPPGDNLNEKMDLVLAMLEELKAQQPPVYVGTVNLPRWLGGQQPIRLEPEKSAAKQVIRVEPEAK